MAQLPCELTRTTTAKKRVEGEKSLPLSHYLVAFPSLCCRVDLPNKLAIKVQCARVHSVCGWEESGLISSTTSCAVLHCTAPAVSGHYLSHQLLSPSSPFPLFPLENCFLGCSPGTQPIILKELAAGVIICSNGGQKR